MSVHRALISTVHYSKRTFPKIIAYIYQAIPDKHCARGRLIVRKERFFKDKVAARININVSTLP